MRKLLMLAVMTCAAMVLGVTPALAQLPNGDDDPQNWSSVVIVDNPGSEPCDNPWVPCSFETNDDGSGAGADWDWYVPEHYWSDTAFCEGKLEGEVGYDGSIDFLDVTLRDRSPGSHLVTSRYGCSAWQPVDGWDGMACYHIPSGEFWLRSNIAMTYNPNWPNGGGSQPTWTGATFGQLTGSLDNDMYVFDGISYVDADADLTFGGSSYDRAHTAEFEFDDDKSFTAVSDSNSCAWTELS